MVQAPSAHSAALQMQIAICNDYLVCVQNVQNVQLFGSTIKLLLLLLPLPPALDIKLTIELNGVWWCMGVSHLLPLSLSTLVPLLFSAVRALTQTSVLLLFLLLLFRINRQ